MAIKLIAGLGNYEDKYQYHRHNVGFWFVDALAHLKSAEFKKESKHSSLTAKVGFGETDVVLCKPQTFVNGSGRAISSLKNFFKLESDEILIVHDELDLDLGKIRLKFGGGHGGHNGLRDTIKAIGSPDFYRIRIGIGHPGHKDAVSDYVLSNPPKKEFEVLQNSLIHSLGEIENIVSGDMDQAMLNLHSR